MAKSKNITEERTLKIANKIKQLRVAKNYTSLEDFANDHELNRIQYWRMEKGCNFTINSLTKILDIHKMTLAEFFKDID